MTTKLQFDALLARHNALVEYEAELLGKLGAMEAEKLKHDALVEAVAWEREFDEALVWLVQTGRYPRDMAGKYDLANERECARAEVDRLIANESAADCEGEG